MAGGEGTRLRPLTSSAPKPLLPLANRPIMEHVISLLRRNDIDEVVVTVAFMANAIRRWFGDGSEHGVRITYAVEDTPLGTAGSVGNARQHLDERFLVISGDVLTDVDLGAIVAEHEAHDATATIGLVRVEDPLEFGIVITRPDGSIERFLEKPSWGQVFSDTINSGIFVLEPEVFDLIEPGRSVDFSTDVFPVLLERGEGLYGAVVDGYWEDVGTLEAYLRAHQDILDRRVVVDISGFEVAPGVWVGEGAEIHPEARVVGPAIVGENCTIEAGAVIGPYSVLGDNARVRRDVTIARSVLLDNVYVGEGAHLLGTIVGRSCDLRRGARCEEGVVLGDETFIGDEAVLAAGVKVYPFKTVEARAIVNTSIVWESRGARSLFVGEGLRGLANVDVTPELATRVAMAFGSTLPKGATIMTSRDSSRSARMLKRAMMAGFNAVGVNVLDLEVASVPVTRFATRQPTAVAGVTLRLDQDDPQVLGVHFFDTDGADIDDEVRRKIERLFDREDFRRVVAAEIGDIGFPPRLLEHYATAVGETVDLSVIRARRPKAVVDYAYGSASFVMPDLLAKLGADVLAVNPFASTAGLLDFDLDAHAQAVGELVRASHADLGAMIGPDGSRLTIIDDLGRVLDHTQALLAVLTVIGPHVDGERIALPVNVTSHATAIALAAGLEVVETPLAPAALMAVARQKGVGFAASDDGGYALPGLLPAFDGAAMLVKLLELLALATTPLSVVVDHLPVVHIARDAVVTPWEQKGQVMRNLVERTDRRLVLVDGVKVHHDDGWVLAAPDPVEPVTHIWAEGRDDASARQLAHDYVRRISQLVV